MIDKIKKLNSANKTVILHLFEFIIMFILFFVGLATRQVVVVILNKEFFFIIEEKILDEFKYTQRKTCVL